MKQPHYLVVKDGHAEFKKGDILVLTANDGTDCPYFWWAVNQRVPRSLWPSGLACFWDRLVPYNNIIEGESD